MVIYSDSYSSGQSQNRNLEFYAHKSSSLACMGALSNTVNYHPYYFLFFYSTGVLIILASIVSDFFSCPCIWTKQCV